MMTSNLINNLGLAVFDSVKKKHPKSAENPEPEVIEEYEGHCDECETQATQPQCSVCET